MERHRDAEEDERARATAQGLDSGQLATLYLEFGPELRRFILGVVRDPDLAADVLQATFARAVELGHTARSETVRGWLFRVALNEALLVRRRNSTGERAGRKLASLTRPPDERPEDSLIRGETAETVRRLLLELPEAERSVVVARVYEDKTFARIAKEQGAPLGTVLSRMRRALERLRQGLQAREDAP